ncbi:uncharacterized protein LOC117121689 isoform X2 [Anneissia japonica]|uniref:uncharacterized protein LOC117121689 isoform X2 n=1 Tax=Anneissia japonica TaxID=1529436 RepID=UPI0014255B3D|nr:uncharacterized protein LOC117121689 isoform X2 [Anneissia japonica]
MEYSTLYFNTLPVIIVLASVFIIIVTLLTCAKKETPDVQLSLSSAVAEENASKVTIGCILKPADLKFTYIRWYRTGDDQKPIGDVLAEIHYSKCNTRPSEDNNENNSKREIRQDPDVSTVCYVNEKNTIQRTDVEGAYANISPCESNESLAVICDDDSK